MLELNVIQRNFNHAVASINFYTKIFHLQKKDQKYFSDVRSRLRLISIEVTAKRKRELKEYAAHHLQRAKPVVRKHLTTAPTRMCT